MLNLIRQLPPASRLRTKLLGAHPDDRWGSAEYLLADAKDWLQYVFLITLANATGKKPPAFKPAPRPEDAAEAERKRQERIKNQDRTERVLEAMRSGDWTGLLVEQPKEAIEPG